MLVSIIVPVAREGAGLYERVSRFREDLERVLEPRGFSFEILLVSDVFHRPTIRAMIRLARRGVARSLLLTRRIGKGGSIKNAIPHAHGDYIILLDADMPVDPRTLAAALHSASRRGLDLLVANRAYRKHGALRRFLSIAYNVLVNMLFATGIRDHQAGFKILSRGAALAILAGRTRTDGLAYDTEVIVWAKKHGFRYGVVNVAWREQRAGSTIPPMRALLTMLADLVMLRLLTLAGKYAALKRIPIGRVIDLGAARSVGYEYMTVIAASGAKRILLDALRKLYAAVAFKGGA